MKSPCIRVCKLNEEMICVGCGRTSVEISNWMKYSEKQREEIIARLQNFHKDTKHARTE